MTFTVKQARRYSDLTQAEISERLGIGVQKYRKYENFPEEMELGIVIKFCEIVGIPIDQIFSPQDNQK